MTKLNQQERDMVWVWGLLGGDPRAREQFDQMTALTETALAHALKYKDALYLAFPLLVFFRDYEGMAATFPKIHADLAAAVIAAEDALGLEHGEIHGTTNDDRPEPHDGTRP